MALPADARAATNTAPEIIVERLSSLQKQILMMNYQSRIQQRTAESSGATYYRSNLHDRHRQSVGSKLRIHAERGWGDSDHLRLIWFLQRIIHASILCRMPAGHLNRQPPLGNPYHKMAGWVSGLRRLRPPVDSVGLAGALGMAGYQTEVD
jgi:hypothetical protein